MKAAEVMTLDVATIRPDATVREAATAMLRRGISGLPVVDTGGRLVGMVTEGDFLRRAETATERRHPHWLEFLLGPGRLATEYNDTERYYRVRRHSIAGSSADHGTPTH
jgi:CBS-domain-containing membrane protein